MNSNIQEVAGSPAGFQQIGEQTGYANPSTLELAIQAGKTHRKLLWPQPGVRKIVINGLKSYRLSDNEVTLSVSDLRGNEFITEQVYDDTMEIDISGLVNGVYFVEIILSSEPVQSIQFIKQGGGWHKKQ